MVILTQWHFENRTNQNHEREEESELHAATTRFTQYARVLETEFGFGRAACAVGIALELFYSRARRRNFVETCLKFCATLLESPCQRGKEWEAHTSKETVDAYILNAYYIERLE